MAELLDLFRAGDVENQWIVLGPPLGFKNLCNGLFVQTVGTQAVNRLGGNGYQSAALDDLRRDCRRLRIGSREKQSFHGFASKENGGTHAGGRTGKKMGQPRVQLPHQDVSNYRVG